MNRQLKENVAQLGLLRSLREAMESLEYYRINMRDWEILEDLQKDLTQCLDENPFGEINGGK
jgi:hypothetical protein